VNNQAKPTATGVTSSGENPAVCSSDGPFEARSLSNYLRPITWLAEYISYIRRNSGRDCSSKMGNSSCSSGQTCALRKTAVYQPKNFKEVEAAGWMPAAKAYPQPSPSPAALGRP
jgi:hypothetical protein